MLPLNVKDSILPVSATDPVYLVNCIKYNAWYL
jgi:hypothetical protein